MHTWRPREMSVAEYPRGLPTSIAASVTGGIRTLSARARIATTAATSANHSDLRCAATPIRSDTSSYIIPRSGREERYEDIADRGRDTVAQANPLYHAISCVPFERPRGSAIG